MNSNGSFAPDTAGTTAVIATTTGVTFTLGTASTLSTDLYAVNLGTAGAALALGSITTGAVMLAPSQPVMIDRGGQTSGTATAVSGSQTIYLTTGQGRAV